ncbi:D-alanyl-D-alanine carboxypeptidase/D-alanyl-D-alanine-endopeptidase [Psychromonas sp. 14N.309.X.WAT.B.A12]|uniref:D-alanyl-D-alanine carboxypeptidase/D-alanyl-D-alanine endopeptidase n=1 Tax=Psychromonas sp. 14N.309.X.WAT.B.A12 TaxID=2998322 RepID=UPI0025B01FAD|nr:D-alanyl-D-alanine carboxypeptidase/D-alanyl-D-alanine-endopeptidase [Psychromonas sp. 14N.309.X.WAT.B.A12]MDN2664687.1 D-alanyl-D-alanine carboxypeptidase/D-alanyl-D-alanine-endopeptidase [Psychromonas sp. 14N.309.X.WAT.B.A12]
MLKVCWFFISSILSVSVLSSPVLAQQWQQLQSLLPKGTQVSYLVLDPHSKKTIASFQEETLKTPASVQKLLTATTAKLYLGDDFRYQTAIQGDKKALKAGIYKGDLSLHFSGDPTLTRQHIKQLLQGLKRAGVNKIEGDFLLDNSAFNGYQWSNGQAWNDLGVCYTSPTSAIIVNRNCVQGNLSVPAEQAEKARLFVPDYEPVDITADVDVVTKEQRDTLFCDLELTRDSHNKYHLWGCMVPRKRAFPLAFAVNDPNTYAQKIVEAEIKQVGINLIGDVKVATLDYQKTVASSSVLASHLSPSLSALLKQMMKDSDNLIADSLFKTVGAHYFQQAGNFRNGTKAMKAILKEQGIDLENAYIADGSGLSRHNLMSAELFMSVMKFVYQQEAKLGLLDSLSVAGVDGTLRYHKGVNAKALKGKVIAKTGSLKGVANLVGIVKSPTGDKLFVLMINGYNQENSVTRAVIPRVEKASAYLFEKAFFKHIYEGTTPK